LISRSSHIYTAIKERVWKKTGVAYFKELSKDLPEGTEENHEKPQSE
jgi:hypothetical protein